MYESHKARSVCAQKHDSSGAAFLSASAGALFVRASQLSEEVHQAMVARGYRGDAKTVQPFALCSSDVALLVAAALCAALAVGGDRFLGR